MANNQSNPDIEDWMYPYLGGALDFTTGLRTKVRKSKSHKIGYTITPVVRFTNVSRTPLGMIDAFCDEYNINTVMHHRDSGSYFLEISGTTNVKELLESFRPYILGLTEQVDILLNRIIPALERGDHREKEGFLSVMKNVEEFREHNNRGKSSKYTKEFFEDEWDL
ncbi:hypothetical protein [Halocatena halophila]|uniref:hypothetical protein n=1 Tax=Halocatena halophila TaxID=2814576 RepID=UPI002ECFD945